MYIDPTVYQGRPSDDRIPQELAVYDKLEELGISFTRVDHDHADTMEDCLLIERTLGARICKNLFLRNSKGDHYYLLMLPGEKKFKAKDVAHQIGSTRLSFADEEKLKEYLDILPGSVSVMGLMNDHDNQVELLMDEDILKLPYVGCHPCMSTTSLKLSTKDLLEKFLPAVRHTPRMVKLENG